MRAAFDDAAVAQDYDLIGVLHGGRAMRNQDGGAAFHNTAETREDAFLGLGVDGGKGIVEDQDARIADDGASDGAALLLSAGQGDAALTDYGVVFFGEGFDVGIEVGNFRGGANRSWTYPGSPKATLPPTVSVKR